jgi:ubiquinone/menaquinone biosynthesis C-methylase UbiE
MQNHHAGRVDQGAALASSHLLGGGQTPEKVQGHWALARAGKRVLRPGGLELTRQMLEALDIGPPDRVVEFAPGLGVTARLVLQRQPCAYCGVEREPAAAEQLRKQLEASGATIVLASAERSGLPDATATVVYGEALLTMQTPEQKSRIIAEACRLLAPGGRYAIHEICLLPDEISDTMRREIRAAMSKEIHVGVQPLTRKEWTELLERHRFKVIWHHEAPMRLLETSRILQDEGLAGALRFAFNVVRTPVLRHRVLAMRRLFRRYQGHLGSISLIGERTGDA